VPGSLHLVRKLGGSGRLNAVATVQLIHMLDQISNRRFLVDNNASYSILPNRSSLPAVGPKLFGPACQLIPCWRDRLGQLRFQDQDFSWKFLLADVAFPILGVDFLRAHKLLIDPDGHALLDSTGRRFAGQLQRSPPTATVVIRFVQPYKPMSETSSAAHGAARVGAASAGVASAGSAIAGAAIAGAASAGAASAGAASTGPASKQNQTQLKAAYSRLLEEFPAMVCSSKRLPPFSHDVVHNIVTHGPPIASQFRKLDGENLAAAKAEFKQLEEDNIIQLSTSLWSSPLHMVRKADGSWRPCGDFRRLNLVTEPDVYPLPNMLDFAAKAAGCTAFSKIDLRKGYHQIPVNPEDMQKTAITTPFGLFEYKRMPFGLRNAGPSFQRHVDRAIRDCQVAFAWVDDVVICSRNHEEHVVHVRQVLQALQDNGLVIHAEKCVWGVQELEYLGHKISAIGVLPLPSHVATIQEFPRPTIIELQAFLGIVNFLRRFLPSIACTLRPLTDGLRCGRKGADKLEWSAAMDAAMQERNRPSSQLHTWLIPWWGRSCRWWWTPRRHT
jgi:hypothetical protein